jgi:hypothetical protein
LGTDNLVHDFRARFGAIAFLMGTTVAFARNRAFCRATAKAIKTDSLTIPTPGDFLRHSKARRPDWAGQYRTPIPMTYRNRGQIALNLGGLIADGFMPSKHRTVNR